MPNQQTDNDFGEARTGKLEVEIPESLYFFSNPCIIGQYPNGIVIYDCYVTDGSTLETDGFIEIVVAKKLAFLEGHKPKIVNDLGFMKLTVNESHCYHFYMEWLIDKGIKHTSSLSETKKWFEKIINKK